MELFEFIINLLVALAALVIAFFQWKAEIRKSNEEAKELSRLEDEKRTVQGIVEQILKIEECSTCILEIKAKMDAFADSKNSNPNEVMATFDKMLEEYTTIFKKIEPYLKSLYKELLANEEKFPMSHGYGRHITDLRAILDFDAVERKRRNNNYDRLRIEVYVQLSEVYKNGGKLTPQICAEFGQKTEQMFRALEPYYEHSHQIQSILYELKVKYTKLQ